MNLKFSTEFCLYTSCVLSETDFWKKIILDFIIQKSCFCHFYPLIFKILKNFFTQNTKCQYHDLTAKYQILSRSGCWDFLAKSFLFLFLELRLLPPSLKFQLFFFKMLTTIGQTIIVQSFKIIAFVVFEIFKFYFFWLFFK